MNAQGPDRGGWLVTRRRPRSDRLLRRLSREHQFLARRLLALPIRGDLGRLGLLFGTDKAWRHDYMQHYERHLAPLRRKAVVLLEIGVGGYKVAEGGASLGVWQSYFPRGRIHGLDVQEKHVPGRRITVHEGSQADEDYLRGLGERIGPLDVVIDDGSHVGRHIVTSFTVLFPCLKPGGWYVIEDMETAYLPFFGGGPPGKPNTSVQLTKDLVDSVNRWCFEDKATVTWDVDELHVYEQIAFLRKAGNRAPAGATAHLTCDS
jgi:hypothetical protein